MKKILKWLLVLLLLIAATAGGSILLSYKGLRYSEVDCNLRGRTAEDGVRLAVISDLHGNTFGKENERLADKLAAASPDIIIMAGDMLNESSADADAPVSLVRRLADTAPIFYALGNHEQGYMEKHPEFVSELEQAGARVLEYSCEDLEINGMRLRLGGMSGYAFGLNGFNEAEAADSRTSGFLEAFQDTDRVKIMLAHRPDSFIFGNAASYWKVDLVISGHDHGGQVVVPFAGGLYGGDQGWFPEYIHGLYTKDNIRLYVTNGLGSDTQRLPRLNNIPEIALITVR